MKNACRILKDKTTFIGNIDPSGILANGSTKEVRQKTEELISVFSDSPRFILNAGCAIPPITPSANIHEMIKVARGQ
jgi:uroporphyrinogen decarboxylase